MGESQHGGIFKGKSHAEGGIPLVVPETGQQLEVESEEPLIPNEALESSEIKEYTGTNFQILYKINKSVGAKGLSEKATEIHAGDVIICKKSLNDKTIKTLKGTHRQIVSAINVESGCNVIEKGGTITDEKGNTKQFKSGGEVDESQLEKGIKHEHEHKGLYLKLKARMELKGVKMVISEENFYKEIAQVHIDKKPKFYSLLEKMDKGGKVDESQLKQGVEIEKEHNDIYLELKRRLDFQGIEMPMSKEEFFERIAIDHIEEIPKYYTFLKKMEEEAKQMADGGEVELEDTKKQILDANDEDFINVYHATTQLVDFIKPSDSSNYSYSEKGYVYVATNPNNALGYVRMLNKKPYLYQIKIKKKELLPDLGMIKTHGGKKTLQDSISLYGLARVKRMIYGSEITLLSYNEMSDGGSTEKRYVAEADYYVYANNDKEAEQKAKKITYEIDSKYDNKAFTKHLYEQQFGKLGSRKVFSGGGEVKQWNVMYRKTNDSPLEYLSKEPVSSSEAKELMAKFRNSGTPYYELAAHLDIGFAKGGSVGTKKNLGDCYYVAGRLAIPFLHEKKINYIGKPYLVHAEVKGQGNLSNVRFGHAWVEDDVNVYDYSNGKELVILKQLYYAVGDVHTSNPSKYKKYTFEEAITKMSETGNYGCWDLDVEYKGGGEVKTQNDLYNEWVNLVNMTKTELEEFKKTNEGKNAGLTKSKAKKLGISSGQESSEWIIKMKTTTSDNWTPTMWEWAKKQVNFIKRMSGVDGELYDENGNKTRKHTSLLIWGHNPEKKLMADGGKIESAKPIRQLGTGANVYFETEKYRVNDSSYCKGKTFLNIGDANSLMPLAIIKFTDVNEAVYVAKKLNENAPNGLVADFHNVDKIIDRFKNEYMSEQPTEVDEYENFIKKSIELNETVDKYSDKLQSFPTGEMGLIPSEIRNTIEFKEASTNFKKAFKELQEFNKKVPKEFAQRRMIEWRTSRINKAQKLKKD